MWDRFGREALPAQLPPGLPAVVRAWKCVLCASVCVLRRARSACAAGMDIAERGSGRLDKHSGEQEVQGLLERTPPRNGGLGRQHSGGGGGGGGGGSRLSHSPGGGHSTADHAVVAVNGSGSFADGRFGEQEKEGGGGGGGSGFARVSVDGFAAGPGGGAAGGRRRQGLQRDSSESLVFEVEPPSSPLLTPGSASRRSVSFLTAMLMGVALCFHSLLEGAAMGAQTTIRCGGLGPVGLAGGLGRAWPPLARVIRSSPTPPPPTLTHTHHHIPPPCPHPQQLAAHLHRHCEPQGAGRLCTGQLHRRL